MENRELLNYAIEHGMINMSYVQEQMEMTKRIEILQNHPYSIWYNSKEDRWYTEVPYVRSKSKKKRIKKRNRKDLENEIIKYTEQYQKITTKKDTESCSEMTLNELFYEFMEYKVKEVGSGTIRRMMADWKKFYEPHQELISQPFMDITKIDIDNFFNAVMDEYKLKKKAFYNMCGIIKQVYEYAIDSEYTDKTPYRNKVNKKKFASSQKAKSETQVYTEKEKELLIQEMERRLQNNPQSSACIAVMLDFELGTRKGELLAISKKDIEGDRIHIHRQLVEHFDISDLNNIKSLGFQIVEYTKSEDGDRWLPLTKRAKELIYRVMEINNTYGFSYKDFLFVKKHKILSPDAVDAQIRRGCKYIGVPVKTMHKIRKTYASTLYHNGVNVSIVKDVLGHADESTTLKHYIFNIEDPIETDEVVRTVLENKVGLKVGLESGTQWDSNIISFPEKKNAESPHKSRLPAHN